MVLQNKLGVAQEYSATGELFFPHALRTVWICRGLGIALFGIRHAVFDVRSSFSHKEAGDDGVMVFDIQVC